MKFASLCVLAYKRPVQLAQCLESIFLTTDFPHEIIVNLDGDDSGNSEYLFGLYKQKKISKLIMQAGNNRGVGKSFENCLAVAEGDYLFKIDTDLTFEPQWLSKTVSILENNNDLGCVSLFNYRHYDPKDERFNVLSERDDCYIVNDFVSSIYAFSKIRLPMLHEIADDGNHQNLGGALAITKEDLCTNSGFGVYKSTYVSGTEENPYKTPTYPTPLIFRSGQ